MSGLTRRGFIGRVGAASGAGMSASLAGFGEVSANDDPSRTIRTDGRPSDHLDALPAVDASRNYTMIAGTSFTPFASAGLVAVSDFTRGLTVTAGSATFVAPLLLPQGAQIHEIAFECFNSSTNIGLGVSFVRLNVLTGNPFTNTAFSDSNANKHTKVLTLTNEIVDNTTKAYSVTAFLQTPNTQFGFYAARVAWTGGLSFVPLLPQPRKLDTRQPTPLPGKFVGGETKVLSLAPEVPAGAKVALINVTATGTEGAGFLSAFPAGTAWPGTSTINWSSTGQDVANSTAVALSSDRSIALFCGNGKTNVVVDVAGYYI